MKNFTAGLTLAALVVSAHGAVAKPLTGHEYLPQAKIGLDRARAIALHARPGRITDEELEKEKGGSGL
ncbi:MAG TPA: peptidase M4, partial [Caulobacteraceae bacterium]|nr:peptidase M4 [Caulobacteraceae bacterium]